MLGMQWWRRYSPCRAEDGGSEHSRLLLSHCPLSQARGTKCREPQPSGEQGWGRVIWKGSRACLSFQEGFPAAVVRGTPCVAVALPCCPAQAGEQPVTACAAPASLSHWAAGDGLMPVGTALLWDSTGSPVPHSSATLNHPLGPLSCCIPRAKHPVFSSKLTSCSCPHDPIWLCQKQVGLHRAALPGRGVPRHLQIPQPRKFSVLPRVFCAEGRQRSGASGILCAPGRHTWLARARAWSRAGRGSICFAAPRGSLNRSLHFYSLLDLEKPVVLDNLWTRQHHWLPRHLLLCSQIPGRGGGTPAPPAG